MPTPRAPPLLLVLALLAPTAALLFAAPASAAAPTVTLVSLEGRHGTEAWKDESATFGDATKGVPFPVAPPGATGVYRNPYSDPFRRHDGPGSSGVYLGASLRAALELTATDPAVNYLVDARLATPWGDIPAKLTKRNATGFIAELDLDGESGKRWPNVLAPGQTGTFDLVVTVNQVTAFPSATEVPLATVTFPVTTTPAVATIPGLLYPDDRLPGYGDLGAPVNLTRLALPARLPNATVDASIEFGIPDAPARVVAWNGAVPYEVFNGTTNSTGAAVFSFEPAIAGQSGLLVVAGHLTGESGTFAAANAVVPFSARTPRLIQVGPSATGPGGVPAPGGTFHAVTLQDPDATAQAGSRRGTLLLVANGDVLGTAEFAPPGTDARFRTAYVQASALAARAGLTRYDAFAFLSDNSNRFYGLAHASRGLDMQVETVPGGSGQRSLLRVMLTNLNDNDDALRGEDGDAGLSLRVQGEVSGIAGESYPFDATVPEASSVTVEVGFVAPAGLYPGLVNATAAEFSLQQETDVLIPGEPGLIATFMQRVPAPDALAALAALGVALALTGARRRRDG